MGKLPDEILPLLFSEVLYVLPDPDSAQPAGRPATKGANQKNILILNRAGRAVIDPAEEVFLFKGLNALDIYLEDVLIVNPGTDNTTFDPAAFQPRTLLIFSTEYHQAPEALQVSQQAGIKTLPCPPLGQIMADTELKKKFWVGLKALFGR